MANTADVKGREDFSLTVSSLTDCFLVAYADLDIVVSLEKGEYEIHVALDEETKTFHLSVTTLEADDAAGKASSAHHPLLRAVVGSNLSPAVQQYDAANHHVVAQSKLEFIAFFKLLSSAGSFPVYAHPLAFKKGGRERAFEVAPNTPPRVLIIAGSDSGGGAGIQADLKACTNLGVFSSSAITAVTVQNTQGVHGVHAIPVNDIADQITCVLDDIGADVVKTGMLFNEEIIEMVATVLGNRQIPLIVDPVMVATSGDRLLHDAAHKSLVRSLFPLASLITPNIPEASVLLDGRSIETLDDMKAAAKALAAFGSKFVLVKGGHLPDTLEGQVHDVLFDAETQECHVIPNKKLATKNTHGTGCTLASAIAAELAKTGDMVVSVKTAIAYLHRVLVRSEHLQIGKGGSGPMLHVV